MPEPLIALPLPTRADLQYNRECLPAYLEAIRQAGGKGVPLSPEMPASAVEALLREASGILLTGSPADVDTARYGQKCGPHTAPADAWREEADRALLRSAEQRGLPVLGICYGLQSLNVWRGGTLVQHLEVLPVNHSAGPAVAAAHAVDVRESSLLAGLAAAAGEERHVLVNSSHHQAVGTPGDGLTVVARSTDDQVVEALEGSRASLGFEALAVQWHPERSVEGSALSRAIFSWLINAAGA